ncbi:MAG TPA: patatin-like phospholipase family protein [Capillimicrobium sp.]|nr:patatin-like phospholipase family protein [Capillimicrobium sp.]
MPSGSRARPLIAPDALVLAAGGVAGEAWMAGVLAGIEDATGIDFRRTEQLVGTSAGAIVAATLAAGRAPRRPPSSPPPDDADGDEPAAPVSLLGAVAGRTVHAVASATLAVAGPAAAPLLAAGAPAGALARALVLARLPAGRASLDDLRDARALRDARFDGRLRVVAVDRATGRRVVFGAPGAPHAAVGEAVAASCAVPGLFRPVRIGGREYVDGAVWSPTNLDVVAAGRGTEILCLSVFGALPPALPAPLAAIRAGARAIEAVEARVVRRRGARLRVVGPDARSAAAIGGRLMDRGRVPAALAAGHAQGLALAG